MSICRHILIVLVCAARPAWAALPYALQRADTNPSRLVHHFDFDERGQGNVEDLPRYWRPLKGPSFPQFARGGFDAAVGHEKPPSLRLESMGVSAAMQYEGPEIPVAAGSEYLLTGFIRAEHLHAGRVSVSAHYVEEDGGLLPATMKRVEYLGGEGLGDWRGFELQLPPAPSEAAAVRIVLWVLQASAWEGVRDGQIQRVDVRATAWLDDVSVYRMPGIELTTRAVGEITAGTADDALWVRLWDSIDERFAARLTICAADGRRVIDQEIRSSLAGSSPQRIDLSALEPGLYVAEVSVLSGKETVASRARRFLKSPADLQPGLREARSFGIVLDAGDRAEQTIERSLLTRHAARSVKVPIGGFNSGRAEGGSDGETDYLQMLIRDHFWITGIVGLAMRGEGTVPGRPAGWDAFLESESQIADMAASRASLLRWWQVGEDRSPVFEPVSIVPVLQKIRAGLAEYTTRVRVGAVLPAWVELVGDESPAEQWTLAVEGGNDLDSLPQRIATLRKKGAESIAAFVPPLPSGRYERASSLAEWARRILWARHAGADVVFVPQPWSLGDEGMVEPHEEFLVSHSIATVLGDAKPGPELSQGGDVRCLTFCEAERCAAAIWDQSSGERGRTVAVQLGRSAQQVSLWGQASEFPRDDQGRSLVTVSDTPVLIRNIDSLAVHYPASFRLEPAEVESGVELVTHELVVDAGRLGQGSGTAMMVPPEGVEVSPRWFDFSLRAQQELRIPFQVRYAPNQPAGVHEFRVQIRLSDPAYFFEIPLLVVVRMGEMEVSGKATIQRGDLVLRHTLWNHSNQIVSFRSIAGVPGRQRQYRPVSNLQPGEVQVIEYRFKDAGGLMGRKVNLALRELNDGPRKHNIELVVP